MRKMWYAITRNQPQGGEAKKEARNMEILKPAAAGTLESSDAMVTVEPGGDGVRLELSSSVMNQYGRQIRDTVLETLERLEVRNAHVTVVDKGALDCTVRARVSAAAFRAAEQDGYQWEAK